MSDEPAVPLSDDEIRRYHALRSQSGGPSTPRGVRSILWAVVASLVWLVLVGPLTGGTGQSLSDATSRSGSAAISQCHRKWQSFGQTWACAGDVVWDEGGTESVTVTSPADVSAQQVPVVVRHSLGRFNTNSGTRNTGRAHVVTADHPHRSQGWNNVWVLSLTGLVVVWVVAGVAISRPGRR